MCGDNKISSEYYVDKKSLRLYSKCKKCFNISSQNKIDKMIREGLRPAKKYVRMSKDIKNQILSLYSEGKGSKLISDIVGYDKNSVLTFLNKQGVVKKDFIYRKHKFKDEYYFDNIDSDDKAYFLGLLWADGCNYRRVEKNKNAHQIIITLQEQDGYILKDLANRIFFNDDIVSFKLKKVSEGFENRKPQYTLRIPSKHISDILLNYGMTPRKSFDVGMPINIIWTDTTLRGFIRGFFDGDGSIYHNSNTNSYGASFISSVRHIEEMNFFIEKGFGKKMSIELKNNYSQPMAACKFHGNQITKSFLDWLYKGSTIHLTRKYDRYLKLKNIVGSKSDIKDKQE